MAEIHILPIDLDAVALDRSYEALKQRFEAGDDLGDRRHHIRTLQKALAASHQSLALQIEALRALPPMPALETEFLHRSLDTLAGALATCAAVIDAQRPNQQPNPVRSA